MLTDRIVGRVGAEILRARLGANRGNTQATIDSAAFFRLDRLAPSHVASVVRELLANPDLSSRVDIRIPASIVEGYSLPPEVITEQNAGAIRNAGTTREALLTANGNEHNLTDTLGHVSALGARELRSEVGAWVSAACHVTGISPTREDRSIFEAALKGLIGVSDLSLRQLGDYCAQVCEAIRTHGHPIRDALGWALPFVELPRDTSLFSNARVYGTSARPWRKIFDKLFSSRAPLLKKLRSNGQPLDAAELTERLEANAGSIAQHAIDTLTDFIRSTPGDIAPVFQVLMLEWEKDGVYLLFDKPRERQQGLAQSTIAFFDNDCEEADVLDESSRRYLDDLRQREGRSEWNDDDEAFFELYRHRIESNPRLYARWEKVIYGKPIECHDFLDGLATVAQRLVAQAGQASGERYLRFTVSKGRKEWRERFNYDVGAYFSVMYRGVKELLNGKADWKLERMGSANLPDPLFDYPAYFERERETRANKLKQCSSVARAALQIKFEVALMERLPDNPRVVVKTQLLWSFRPDSIGMSLRDDMRRLLGKGAVCATDVPRRLVSKKGGVQSVSLLDVNTFEATFARDTGSLVPPPAKLRNVRKDLTSCIETLCAETRISREHADELRTLFDTFCDVYCAAVCDFSDTGLHADTIMHQAAAFGSLLSAVVTNARGDVCRSRLTSQLLSIGTVRVVGDQPCIIIPPWHPERMKALAVKTRRVAGLVAHLLDGSDIAFGDRNIFFREFSEELAHPFYPEIAVATRNAVPVLVSETSTVNGYSLLERPVADVDDDLTDVEPGEAARHVGELASRYVGLQPHEASNLSILLYNADAAALPLATVRELGNMQTEGDFQCSVAVRHHDPAKLRRVYAELMSKVDEDPDGPVVSETSENFISRLRISVAAHASTYAAGPIGFRPFDIAFLHDVVARTAVEEWIRIDHENDRLDLEHAPSRWSYRSVSGEDELKSTTFLTCPRQTASGWAYVDAVAAVVRQRDTASDAHYIPARQISLQNERLRTILDDSHNLAEWVATYDELLDKRQLQANNITVVRYRRARTNGRNMIVSSTSELRLLGVLVRRRLGELGLPLSTDELSVVADRIKRDAISVSGDIVLRAAKRGVSAGEMLGLVLSRFLVDREFRNFGPGDGCPTFSVFFLLDDYADWLAQKESRIADLLGLHVEETDDGILLRIVVVESKYVAAAGLAEARRSSKAQLMATLSTFREALFGAPGRLDRDLWLSRIADLLLDADLPPGSTDLLERARARVRDGEARIALHGYSHVFVHSLDAGGTQPGSERFLLDSTDGVSAWQEVYDRPELRALVAAYSSENDPFTVRALLGSDCPWLETPARVPAPRVSWTGMVDRLMPQAISQDTETFVPSDELTPPVEEISESVSAAELLLGDGKRPFSSGVLEELISRKSTVTSRLSDEREAWADETARRLKSALNGYGFQATILGTRLTPNGCLVRLAGSDKLRMEDVEGKRMQLLTTHAITLVTVQPKPGEIVVTVASPSRRAVSLWDIWRRRDTNRDASGLNTSFVLGLQEIDGSLLYLNLGREFGGLSAHEPHSLVAGATGSGKSVLIQAILLDIAATNPKELAQIVLVDPKMGVDYSALESLPHMREPIIVSRERAARVLGELVDEMEERYRLFAAARARDLATYNSKSSMAERLPMIFLVHDEFADWMLDDSYKSAVSAAVQRLGVKARAAGIHLIFAAQRPDKDVMPMQLRENLGNRLILKVASEATSKIALDRAGAELLLGKGHMAAKLNGEQGLVFAQAPFLSDSDICEVVDAIRMDSLRSDALLRTN